MKNKKTWSSKRRSGISIPVGRSLLFIYCGVCTEPYYFGFVMKYISKNFLEASRGQTRLEVDEKTDSVDPLNMARDICSIIANKGKTFDEVWVVFDKDSFMKDNFDNAIHSIQSMNKEKSKTRYYALWSNQCIELWFILHYEYFHTAQFRKDYYPKLTHYLHEKYEKAKDDIGEKIVSTGGSLDFACKNAHKLLEMFKDESYSNKWPATNVVELFDVYKDFLK